MSTKHFLEPFHVPNKIFLGLAWLILFGTGVFAVLQYGNLPKRIPIHFGLSGIPDAFGNTSVGTFFLPFFIGASLTVGLSVLYHYPRYTNVPGTLLLDLLKPDGREQVVWMIRHRLVLTMVLVDALVAYLTIATVQTALGFTAGLNPWIMFGLIGLILLETLVYSIASVVWAHRLVKEQQTPATKQ